MKLKKCLLTVAVISTLGLATIAQAQNLLFQAGDIKNGEKHSINSSSGVASYYKDGTTGTVIFNCDLEGNADAQALLFPGKNFMGSPSAMLKQGVNGPYTWNLSNQGEKDGNIKVQYLKGGDLTIQCKQIN